MKALIPMAGAGSRFEDAGYTFPKPLIDVAGKPMIQVVIETLPECDEYIFLCRAEHIEKYNLVEMLESITPGRVVVYPVSDLTEGAACTALLAREFIDNDEPLLIANSDQYVEYDKRNFETLVDHTDVYGVIFTFNACHPKWSFAKLERYEGVIEVAEKRPISNVATCGLYYFSKGRYFVSAADEMIRQDIRTNGEFYIAPVYNQLVRNDCQVLPFFVDKMHGLGTPEDLEAFLRL
jgi:dTDP-glucose pyrophosphorylase